MKSRAIAIHTEKVPKGWKYTMRKKARKPNSSPQVKVCDPITDSDKIEGDKVVNFIFTLPYQQYMSL